MPCPAAHSPTAPRTNCPRWPPTSSGCRSSSSGPRQPADQRVEQLTGFVGPEPLDARVPPEPGPLAAGELPGPGHRQVDHLVEVGTLLDVRQQLPVAERL